MTKRRDSPAILLLVAIGVVAAIIIYFKATG